MKARLNLGLPGTPFFFSTVCELELEGEHARVSYKRDLFDMVNYTVLGLTKTNVVVFNKAVSSFSGGIFDDDFAEEILKDLLGGDDDLQAIEQKAVLRFEGVFLSLTKENMAMEFHPWGFCAEIRCLAAFYDRKSEHRTLKITCILIDSH